MIAYRGALMIAYRGALTAALLWVVGGAAAARAPIEIEQLEPQKGALQIEYQGVYGREDGHAIQVSYGLGDHFVLGGEIEGASSHGRIRFDQGGLLAVYRTADADEGGFAYGIEAQVDFAGPVGLSDVEARAIVERQGAVWWVQGNLLAVREHNEDGGWDTSLSYAGSFSRRAISGLWIGLEASGDLVSTGNEHGAEGASHYVGPSIILQQEGGHSELELGTSLLARWRGRGSSFVPRCFLQLTF